jgi:hypothetical protein
MSKLWKVFQPHLIKSYAGTDNQVFPPVLDVRQGQNSKPWQFIPRLMCLLANIAVESTSIIDAVYAIIL